MPIITMSRPPIWSLACLGLLLGFASTVDAQGVPRSKQCFNRGTAFVGATGRDCRLRSLEFHVFPQAMTDWRGSLSSRRPVPRGEASASAGTSPMTKVQQWI